MNIMARNKVNLIIFSLMILQIESQSDVCNESIITFWHEIIFCIHSTQYHTENIFSKTNDCKCN
ncbi:putative SP-like 2 [Homarus americanus]|uniref:Putative SP-like 2 n=1 Tax=Homarus americanus TaxID=6706 RepID=A0A8J5KR50_HOMAM|nr:putative SP-like 2 [Homarus americanus]